VGVISGIAGVEWQRLRPLLMPAAGSLFVMAVGGLALVRRAETRRWSWVPVAVGSLGALVVATVGLQAFAPFFGLKPLALVLQREASRGGIVVYDGPSHRASSLCFYTDLPVRWLEDAETEFAVRSRRAGADRFVTERDVVGRWRSREPLWLITEETRLSHWRDRLGGDPGPLIARSGTRVLLGNPVAREGRSPETARPRDRS
jgi:hypothetical protein